MFSYRIKGIRKGQKIKSYTFSTASQAMGEYLQLPRGYRREIWRIGGSVTTRLLLHS